ncbi:lipopolysaccharide biosynthesis protein [Methylobacterium sp. ARG-1]|uniref:lipopolysaccharide biosynthesis protein n=1 Tax=Methylobacterium sp. ARG-1 TaxID=1692501 RepID=UPI000AEB6322|nr:lipopolysaccharide biosynthesis protein [Methylobacterium sp. ARG-1]
MVVGEKTAKSGFILIVTKLSTRLVDLVAIIILARILVPSDFGLVAIASSIVTILETALELPIHQILVRLPEQRKSHYDTAFTLGALRGLILSFIALCLAFPISFLYDDNRLVPLVCCFGIGPAFRSLSSPKLAHYHKNLSFSRDVKIDILSKIIAFILSISMALCTDSYWAMPVGAVGCAISIAALSYVFAPYRPTFSLAEMPTFIKFVKFSSASQIISAVNWQSERLILGKLQSPNSVGLFTTANDVAVIVVNSIFSPLGAPLLAAFSHQIGDRAKFRQSYQTAANATAMIGLPILVGQSLVADLLIRIILGENFLGSVWLFQWLSLSLIPTVFVIPSSPALIAFDEMHLLVKRHAIEFCIKLPILIIGLVEFGFYGLIAARLISEIVINIYLAFAIQTIIALPIHTQLLSAWRSIISAFLMAATVLFAKYGLIEKSNMVPALAELVFLVVLGTVIYIVSSLSLWMLAGRPTGAEAAIFNFLEKSYRRLPQFARYENMLRHRKVISVEVRNDDINFDDLKVLLPAKGNRRRRWRLGD